MKHSRTRQLRPDSVHPTVRRIHEEMIWTYEQAPWLYEDEPPSLDRAKAWFNGNNAVWAGRNATFGIGPGKSRKRSFLRMPYRYEEG